MERQPLRVAIGALYQETNAFARANTTIDAFAGCRLLHGDSALEALGDPTTTIGSTVSAAAAAGIALIPTLLAYAPAGGPLTADTNAALSDDLCAALIAANDRYDAVLLHLHGARSAVDHVDADGELAQRVRRLVGPRRPIVLILSRRANISPRMAGAASAILVPRSNGVSIGEAAVQVIIRLAHEGWTLTRGFRQLPLLVPFSTDWSSNAALQEVDALVTRIEADNRVLHCAVALGSPTADSPDAGVSVAVTTSGYMALAETYADTIAGGIWRQRRSLMAPIVNVETAVHYAMSRPDGPIVLADVGDDPTHGAPGDGTALLWSLLDLGVTDAALAAIVDPTATAAAFDAGVGGAFRFPLGGRVDHRHGYPIDAAGTVRALNPARGSDRPDCETPGRTALLELEGRHGGSVAVIVCERPARWSSPESLRQHSIDPIKRHVVAVKSAADLRHGFARLATEILTVTTPGITTNDFSFFDFRHLRRPIFPLDEGDSTRPTSG